MGIVLAGAGLKILNMLVLFCADGSGYGFPIPGVLLAVCGLVVIASAILLAKMRMRRASEQDRDMSKSMYLIIILMIIAGCFLTTSGVAFVLSGTLGC